MRRPLTEGTRTTPTQTQTQTAKLLLRDERPEHEQGREEGELEETERDDHRHDPGALDELAPAVAKIAEDRRGDDLVMISGVEIR